MKTRNQIAAFVALLALTGCQPDKPTTGDKQPESPAATGAVIELPKETAPAPVPVVVESKDTFVASMEQKLKDFDAKIDELAKKSEGYKDVAKIQADQTLAALRDQRAKLNTQFDELKKASADAWTSLKAGFESAVTELKKTFENSKAKFSS